MAVLKEILGVFTIYQWIYVLAISLQVSGAIILLFRFWGNIKDKVLLEYCDTKNDLGHKEKDGTFYLDHNDLKDVAKKIYMNRISFIYIILGYAMGIWGQVSTDKKMLIMIFVGMITFVCILVGNLFSHILPKFKYRKNEKMNANEVEKRLKKQLRFSSTEF